MRRDLLVRPEAETDLTAARDWYEERMAGLGGEFILAVDALFASIQDSPDVYPIVHKNVRRGLTRKFPYGVFFAVEEGRIIILGVLHQARNPATWRARA